jgi:CheY-like chemotaxis protein
MHVLVIEENKVSREAIAKQLRDAGHRVTPAANHGTAMAVIERDVADVIVVGWCPGAGDCVRRIRSQELEAHSFIIGVLDKQPPAAIPAVLHAGADDFIRGPIAREELLARIEAPARFRKWAAIAAKHALLDLNGERDLLALQAFRNLGEIAANDLSGLVGPLHVAEGFVVSGDIDGASIPMSIPGERAEIRVSIVIERKLLAPLAGILLCDENAPPSALQDMLREIVNTAGGAMKRAAELERVQITCGLPVDSTDGAAPGEMARAWTATLDGCSAKIGIVAEVNRRANQRVPIAQVREGMVTAHDLRNDTGALILPAGTRLTTSSVERLSGLLGARFVIDVMAA